MTNIVMLARDRFRLTEQALDSLYAHTPRESFCLTLVDDGSTDFRMQRLYERAEQRGNCTVLRVANSGHVLAKLKNLGVWWSEQRFGRGDWLYLSDTDVWFAQHWLERLTQAASESEPFIALWGGQVHPYHQPVGAVAYNNRPPALWEYEMLDGPSWLMRWRTWQEMDGMKDSFKLAPGVCKGEDVDFCHNLTAAHMRIGVIHPHVVVHTGLTNSDGQPAPGIEERRKMIPQGVLAE